MVIMNTKAFTNYREHQNEYSSQDTQVSLCRDQANKHESQHDDKNAKEQVDKLATKMNVDLKVKKAVKKAAKKAKKVGAVKKKVKKVQKAKKVQEAKKVKFEKIIQAQDEVIKPLTEAQNNVELQVKHVKKQLIAYKRIRKNRITKLNQTINTLMNICQMNPEARLNFLRNQLQPQ